MRYRYEDLGDREFQQLIQALLAHSLGSTLQAMPIGKADGGRDALHGTSVYQVKFTIAPHKVKDPVTWLIDALDGETEKIIALVERGARTYYLITNIEGTGNLDTGTIDRLSQALAERSKAWSIEILPWWRETIDAQVSAAPNHLLRPFIRILPPDQILALTKLDGSPDARRRDRILLAYLRDRYAFDDPIRFGEVDLIGPTVDKLFVDVPVASREAGSAPYRLMEQLGAADVEEVGRKAGRGPGQWQTGASFLLLHPAWRGNALIVGGPGQGKTTLLQFVCQVYRSLHLDDGRYLRSAKGIQPHVVRVPFRVELREYGEWLTKVAKRRKKDPAASEALEEYLAWHVGEHSGRRFTTDDLAELLAEHPVLLALDGLDEVADLKTRERVAEQIGRTATRLAGPDFDVVIVVTTRPGASGAPEQLGPRFPHLLMQRLTKRLQLAYLRHWAEQSELDTAATDALRSQFIANLHLPHVAELASSPMQMAILLHLLQRRRILPEQRTELYADYVKVFFDRESPKEPIVDAHRKLVLALHRFLAWHLQSAAERGASSGGIPLADLRRLIGEFLTEYDETSPDLAALFTSVTSRVVCLVQRASGVIEFEVQPLREYFAASYLAERAQPRGRGTKDARLSELIKRPYWSNVLRFFVGMWSEAELKGLPTIVREVRAETPFDVLPLTGAVLLQLLRDQVYQGLTTVAVRGAVEAALEGPQCLLATDGLIDDTGEPVRLSQGPASQVVAYTRARLLKERVPALRDALAILLRTHDTLDAARQWWWSAEVRQPTMAWLRTAAHLGALSQLTTAEAEHVIACAEQEQGSGLRAVVLPLLIAANSDISSGPLIRLCLDDLADRYQFDSARSRNDQPERPLSELVRHAHPEHFYDHRRAGLRPGAARGATARQQRHRPIAGPTNCADIVAGLAAANQNGDWRAEDSWRQLFQVLTAAFGDSWLLREAIIATPDSISFLPSKPQIGAGATVNGVAAWLRQAGHHNADVGWWTRQRPPATDPLAARTWLCTLTLRAKAPVVAACIPTADELLSAMSPDHTASVLATVHRFCSQTAPRRLDLYAQLHSRSVRPSPIAALLLYEVAFDTTRPELARIVLDDLPAVLRLREDVTRLALELMGEHQSRPPKQSVFAGTRPFIPPGTLYPSHRLGTVTGGFARRVLASPEQWPVDIVGGAARILASALSSQPPLAEIAAADGWFDAD
ncbi:hypothetical protein ABIH81_18550 [Micromonospora sp. HUAS YX12]|uniref:NACHT domain-containing protein n=1 Tax=Micromonospora sp. HUAS YX12 TaxID=3156396 RepID=A0AAU7QTZ3_9ACTN